MLEVGTDDEGLPLIAFQLYDARGELAGKSNGLKRYKNGVTVRCPKGEVLLDVPADDSKNVRYRLYNSQGKLLTWSDGVRTKIYGNLQMDGSGRQWPSSRSASPSSSRSSR